MQTPRQGGASRVVIGRERQGRTAIFDPQPGPDRRADVLDGRTAGAPRIARGLAGGLPGPVSGCAALAKGYAVHLAGALAASCRMRVKLAEHRATGFRYDFHSPRRLPCLAPATWQRRGRMLPSDWEIAKVGFLSNLKIRRKLLIALAPLAAMVVVAALYSSIQSRMIDTAYTELIDKDVKALHNLI